MTKICLPSPDTLRKEVRAFKIEPGLDNREFFNLLKKKIDCFQEQDKYCIICIDEMSIKAHLFYDRSKDAVIGLATDDSGKKYF